VFGSGLSHKNRAPRPSHIQAKSSSRGDSTSRPTHIQAKVEYEEASEPVAASPLTQARFLTRGVPVCVWFFPRVGWLSAPLTHIPLIAKASERHCTCVNTSHHTTTARRRRNPDLLRGGVSPGWDHARSLPISGCSEGKRRAQQGSHPLRLSHLPPGDDQAAKRQGTHGLQLKSGQKPSVSRANPVKSIRRFLFASTNSLTLLLIYLPDACST
jgi:hypothetical protein